MQEFAKFLKSGIYENCPAHFSKHLLTTKSLIESSKSPNLNKLCGVPNFHLFVLNHNDHHYMKS